MANPKNNLNFTLDPIVELLEQLVDLLIVTQLV